MKFELGLFSLSCLTSLTFAILKLCQVISWNWFFVVLPMIIAIGIYLILLIIMLIAILVLGVD